MNKTGKEKKKPTLAYSISRDIDNMHIISKKLIHKQ